MTTDNCIVRYYCNVCECVVKDSINFLDHINGKKRMSVISLYPSIFCTLHTDQRNIGMSMRVEQSTLEQVKRRFEIVKKKKDEEKKKYGNSLTVTISNHIVQKTVQYYVYSVIVRICII